MLADRVKGDRVTKGQGDRVTYLTGLRRMRSQVDNVGWGGEICLQKAVRFGSKNGLKRANLSGLVTCRESYTCKVAFEKGVSKGPKGR